MTEIVSAASGPLSGECRVPGDKSIAHRALILGALGDGRSRIRGWSGGDDNRRTLEALRRMGVRILLEGERIDIDGAGIRGLRPAGEIDCGNSGTAMRLLAGLCAGQTATTLLDGDESLRLRPMRRIKEPLERMGARVEGRSLASEVLPPLQIAGARLRGVAYELPVASAQVKSCVLLAALAAAGATRLREPARSRDHTERLLRLMGAPVSVGEWIVLDPSGWKRRLRPLDMTVAGDLSSAAFVLVAALLLPGSEVVVRGVVLNSTRTGVLDALRAMGADLSVENLREEAGEPVGDVRARSAELRPCELAGDLVLRAIDEVPILAVAATQAAGTTVIRDAGELRRKESDRLAGMARALRRMGCDIEERPDGLRIEGPAALGGASFGPDDVLLDHRIAMSLVVAGLCAAAPVRVGGAETIASSFPTFVETLAGLGAQVARA